MYELNQDEYERVRPLFQAFDYSLAIQAAIAGNNPGRFYVNDRQQPLTALALTVEGYFLAGESENPAANQALRRLFKEQIFSGQATPNNGWCMSLGIDPDAWETQLPELIPTHELEKGESYHYLCRAMTFDWRKHLPDGYQARRVDRALLEDTEIVFPPPLDEWADIEANWGTRDNFLQRAISYCVVHQGQVVSLSNCDCVAGDHIEIGVITHPDYRRRNLGAVAVAATVERCLEEGYNQVGWHCAADNTGSWKTAEKVGFQREHVYSDFFYIYNPVDHLAELGWHHFNKGAYDKTVSYFEQVFAQRQDNPDYYYHLTAVAYAELDNAEQALKYLHAAVDHGWRDAGFTQGVESFSLLHGRPEWKRALTRMSE